MWFHMINIIYKI